MRVLVITVLTFLNLLLVPGSVWAKGKPTKETIVSANQKRTYYLFTPEKLSADHPLPLLVLLHGSGRNGQSLVEKWTELAEKENFIIVGPDSTNSAGWTSGADGPDFLRDVVEELKSKYPIDQRRVYLFGHSAGAIFALFMSLMESQYFAATAVHAGALRPQDSKAFELAQRKIPVALYVGDRDAFFPLEIVEATRDAFRSRDFPVEFTKLPNHTHWYYDDASKINKSVWEFLKQHSLQQDPLYQRYQF